jgi:hypothetical protein
MSSTAATAPTTAADGSTRFLVELDNTWTLLRVYGTEHPAFRRSAEAAAAAVEKPQRISISPRGFTVGKTPVANDNLRPFAQRLRSMGLVGLTAEPKLTATQVVSLVVVLNEADRSRGNAEAVVEKITAATGGRVRAVPLRLDGLRLVEGTGASPDEPADADLWRQMFASAFDTGADLASSAELAHAFESALRGQSAGQWDGMVGVWMRQLASIDPARTQGAHAGQGDGSQLAPADTSDPAPTAEPRTRPSQLDSVATFLGTLSPLLCQRLLKETITGPAVPEPVVLALADRLPAGLVLGALAAVDRNNGQPSAAALSLLRKMSANVPGGAAHLNASPATRAELAEIAATLERLLGTNQEHQFVPEEYLQRRQELSRSALSPAADRAVAYPDERETARHAAGLAFEILATPDAAVSDLVSALSFVTDRVGNWIRTGEFGLAREAMALASGLCGHAEPSISKPAQALVSASVNADDLLQGAHHRTDRETFVGELADLLRQSDGVTLATLLSSVEPASNDPVLDAMGRALPVLPPQAMEGLFKAISSVPPPALLAILTELKQDEAIQAVTAIVPHAAGATRCAAVHVIFRRDFRWPLALIERLLRDDEPEIRRLAVMKAVIDTDLKTAAGFLAAASKKGKYEADVALGLAELLRRQRHHPDVRPAWRAWTWSKRWFVALLFVNIGTPRRAA